jgi:hypothetical protein
MLRMLRENSALAFPLGYNRNIRQNSYDMLYVRHLAFFRDENQVLTTTTCKVWEASGRTDSRLKELLHGLS